MKIGKVGAQLFHSDGQTDTTMLMVAFRHFANPTEMISVTKQGVCVSVLLSAVVITGQDMETGGQEMLAVVIG
jgi:hypothetical protein